MHLIGDGEKHIQFSEKYRELLRISENMRESLMKLDGIVNKLFIA